MKKTKVKKIKKIPGYYDGTLAVKSNPIAGLTMQTPGLKVDTTAALRGFGNKIKNGLNAVGDALGGTAGIAGIVGGAAESVAGALGIEQTATSKAIGQVGQAIGMVNPAIGAGVQILGATMGAGAKFDESKVSTTSDIQDAVSHNTGWGGALFGRDRNKLLRTANTYQNSLVAAERTSQAQLEWANDPANQGMVFTAKDGGIVPGKVKAKISKGELYYNPRTKTLTRVPGSPDKPNTDDDITAFLETGGIVTPHSEKTLMINGKTQAQVFAPMTDKPNKKMSKGTIEARDLGIKNMAILNELTKPSNKQNYDAVYASNGEILEKFKAAIPYIQLGGSAIDALKKEKPETVRLSKPYHKSAPVYVNPYNQLQDIMLGYALSNYNISQSGYTGGQQLSAKIASASDFAKQRAKAYQWKEEQQNANIARNIAEYNKYSNIISDIENKEIDLNAANRAAADNINSQNRQAFYKNVGMYGRDYAGWDSNAALVAALQGLGEYGYSNWGEVVKQLKKLSKNGSKQVS